MSRTICPVCRLEFSSNGNPCMLCSHEAEHPKTLKELQKQEKMALWSRSIAGYGAEERGRPQGLRTSVLGGMAEGSSIFDY